MKKAFRILKLMEICSTIGLIISLALFMITKDIFYGIWFAVFAYFMCTEEIMSVITKIMEMYIEHIREELEIWKTIAKSIEEAKKQENTTH